MDQKGIKRELKKGLETKIEKRILNSLFNSIDNYNGSTIEEKLETNLTDWMHGCKSGAIGEVIYYSDTTKIFNRYKKEIVSLINKYLKLGYFNIYEGIQVFNIDNVTYLLNYNNELQEKTFDTYQKNNLVWFIYDITISNIYYDFKNIIQ